MSINPLKKGAKVFVAGHRGLVGSAIARKVVADGEYELVVRTRSELDLQDQVAVHKFLKDVKPDAIVLAAAKVGGILANSTYPADFIGLNLGIQQNLIWGAFENEVPNFLFLGSSCVYPRETPQPIKEEALLTAPPEPTNAPYAIAKIAGLYLCDAIRKQHGLNYFTAMPPNVYGPFDNFDLKTSHVLPALIRKFHEALPEMAVEVWGSGTPKREFLHSDDVADAIIFLLAHGSAEGHVNVGTGQSITIAELAQAIQRVVGHQGPINWNRSMPDGFPEKTMDVTKLHGLGWKHKISLEEGLISAYSWFKANVA